MKLSCVSSPSSSGQRGGPWLALAALVLFSFGARSAAEAASPLWQIGKPDRDDREFALAPGEYGHFKQDGFFVVGQSEAKRDWPYVQPGPGDGWAGAREHSFTVVFGLKNAPGTGECKLRLDLIDAHAAWAPKLRVSLNGRAVEKAVAGGAGDASIFGDPSKGKAQSVTITWPADALLSGANELAITSVSGSWMLYDALTFEAPPGLELTEPAGTILRSVSSAPVVTLVNGQPVQIIEATLVHFGAAADGVIRVSGAAPVALKLVSGIQTVQVRIPPVKRAVDLDVALETGRGKVASATLRVRPVRQWVVYLLPHSHVDIGYTHVQTEVERAQWKYLETAIETARRTANNPPGSRFKWNVEVLWAVDSYLRQASPEKQAEFVAAVKAGWVGLQALYGNELTGLCRPEELLRLVGFAQTLSQRVGQPITSAMITDVPGYTWGIVPTFAHAGVKYFSIGPNGGDRIGHTVAAWGDKPFWWIGPNGRDKVLTWMTGTGYYQVFQSTERLLTYLEQLEAKEYPYDYVQVRHCLGDNGAPDVNFADKVKAWNETHAYPKLVIATSEEMFRDFEQRYGSKIPSAKGDFTPYWEDGAASSARETAMNRAAADRLTQAETLFAMINPKGYPAETFYQAWRDVVLYDEHTWGAHNSISQPDEPFVKSQWAIKQAFALHADQHSRQLLDAALPSQAGQGAVPNAIDVFNTTSSTLPDGWAVVPKGLSAAGDVVRAATNPGASLPSQRLASGELVFRAPIQPFSVSRFTIGPGTSPASNHIRVDAASLSTVGTVAGSGVHVQLNEKTGAIGSLRYDGQELVDSASTGGLNDFLYLPGSDLRGVQRNGPVKITVLERGPLFGSLLVESEAPGCRGLKREIRLHASPSYLEIINTVDKAPVRAKEGVHFGFGFQVTNATVRMDVPWAVVRPETDQIPGACKNWFTVQRWVDVSNDGHGVTWLTPDAPLVEVGGLTANLIGSLSDPRVWMDRVEPSPSIYSWAMNNHWHTNYRAEQEGPTVFRYYIFPHRKFDQAATVRAANALSQSLVVAAARGEPKETPRLRLSNDNVVVSAFKPAADGQGSVVRLYSASGKDEKVRLAWSEPKPRELWLSDPGETKLKRLRGTIPVPASTIVTLRVD